jgi:hypothetical protein
LDFERQRQIRIGEQASRIIVASRLPQTRRKKRQMAMTALSTSSPQ